MGRRGRGASFALGLFLTIGIALAGPATGHAAAVSFDRAFGIGVDTGAASFQNCTAASTCQSGTGSAASGGMGLPSGVAVDAEGRILVADELNNRIDRFTVAGDGTVSFDRAFGVGVDTGAASFQNCTAASTCQGGLPSPAAGGMDHPSAVAVDAQERILVADRNNNRIDRFTVAGDGTVSFDRAFGLGVATGTPVFENCTGSCQTGVASGAAGGMTVPSGVAVDAQGRILVANGGANRIDRFTVAGDGTVSFDRAFGIGVDTGAASFENCTTASTCQLGVASAAAGGMNFPSGVAVDAQGRILVGDQDNNRIDRFTVAGDGTVSFDRAFGVGVDTGAAFENCTTASTCQSGIGGGAAGDMANPIGVAVDAQQRIFVGDQNNNRIDRFTVAGDGTVSFDRAFGFGVDTGAASFENCTTASTCQSGSFGGAAGAMDNPFGVAIDDDGRILVADLLNNRIDRFAEQLTVTVTKALSPAADPGRFDLRVDGNVVRAGAGNGESGSLEVLAGATVTISEQAAGAQPLSDYDTAIDCGAGAQPGTSLTLTHVSSNVNCTITNTRKASPEPPGPEPPAPVTPDFEIVKTQLNRRAGTATLTVDANTGGIVWVAKTNKVKRTESVSIDPDDPAELEVVPRKSAARRLERKGRLKVNPRVRFGPAAGGELGRRHELTLRRD